MHVGPALDPTKIKYKILVLPAISGAVTPAVRIGMGSALSTLRLLSQQHVSVDRGHRHTDGTAEVCIWLTLRNAPSGEKTHTMNGLESTIPSEDPGGREAEPPANANLPEPLNGGGMAEGEANNMLEAEHRIACTDLQANGTSTNFKEEEDRKAKEKADKKLKKKLKKPMKRPTVRLKKKPKPNRGKPKKRPTERLKKTPKPNREKTRLTERLKKKPKPFREKPRKWPTERLTKKPKPSREKPKPRKRPTEWLTKKRKPNRELPRKRLTERLKQKLKPVREKPRKRPTERLTKMLKPNCSHPGKESRACAKTRQSSRKWKTPYPKRPKPLRHTYRMPCVRKQKRRRVSKRLRTRPKLIAK